MTKTFEEELSVLPVSKSTNYTEYWNKAQLLTVFKDWQPHQPLPEVPEFVAEYIEKFRKSNAFHSIKNLVSGDEYYTYPGLSDEVKNWISENIAHQELLVRAWLDAYTVQKPKRFYLKNKVTCGVLVYDDTPRLSEVPELYATGGEFELENYTFTQEDIDAMEDLGSYEKIEVEE